MRLVLAQSWLETPSEIIVGLLRNCGLDVASYSPGTARAWNPSSKLWRIFRVWPTGFTSLYPAISSPCFDVFKFTLRAGGVTTIIKNVFVIIWITNTHRIVWLVSIDIPQSRYGRSVFSYSALIDPINQAYFRTHERIGRYDFKNRDSCSCLEVNSNSLILQIYRRCSVIAHSLSICPLIHPSTQSSQPAPYSSPRRPHFLTNNTIQSWSVCGKDSLRESRCVSSCSIHLASDSGNAKWELRCTQGIKYRKSKHGIGTSNGVRVYPSILPFI